jgi:hypothetical protein
MFRRRKRKSARQPSPISGRNVKRALAVLGTVVVFGAAGLAVLVEAPRMQQRIAERSAGASPTVIIDWPLSPGAPATWLPAEVQDELLAAAYHELERRPDPFSASALAAIARSLQSTGWFEQIKRVSRQPGNIVRIEASWRTPAAVVRRGNVDYLIARGGELLPLQYQRDRAPLPAIVGAKHESPTSKGQLDYGTPWPGADIRAALDVIALLNTRPWRDQVAAVDVSEYLSSRNLTLVSQWNGRIVWGGAPGDAIPGEVAAEMKLRRLDVLHRQFQRIDARRRIVEVAGPVTLVDDSASSAATPPEDRLVAR